MNELTHTFCVSYIANCLSCLAGHPLDTIKVRIQTDKSQISLSNMLHQTYSKEGLRGFFKGCLSPLVGSQPIRSLVFMFRQQINSKLEIFNLNSQQRQFLAGAGAGTITLAFATPSDVLKCRAQINRNEHTSYSKLCSQIIKNEGPQGLYKGFTVMFLKDVPGWAVFFATYEFLLQKTGIKKQQEIKQCLSVKQQIIKIWCGGTSGQMCWIVTYPFDVVKTAIQTNEKKLRILEVFYQGYQQHGVQYFFKGLVPTLIRSFIVNGICMPLFDCLSSFKFD